MKELDNILINDLVYILKEDTTLKRYYELIPLRDNLIEVLVTNGIIDKYSFFDNTIEELAHKTRVSIDNIRMLRSLLHLHNFKNRKLSEIDNVDSSFIQNLINNGIKNSLDYFFLCKINKSFDIAEKYATKEEYVKKLFSLCDLMRLPGVKSIRANLYYDCGYIGIKDFVGKDAHIVQKHIAQLIVENKWAQSLPLIKELKTQIAVATVLPPIMI